MRPSQLPLSVFAALSCLGSFSFRPAYANPSHEQQVPLTGSNRVCEHPPYKVHIVSRSPLVIYIQDFITPSERAHLLSLSNNTFTRSGVASHRSSLGSRHSALRTSQSTTLPPSDPVVACVESRALAFQGHAAPRSHLEPLQLVKYGPAEHYHFHTDWFPPPSAAAAAAAAAAAGGHGPAAPSLGGNRVSSFFVYVHVAEGTWGGGTNFPRLELEMELELELDGAHAGGPGPVGEQVGSGESGRWWCERGLVDCDEPHERGLTFRPVEGNAVFWVNLLEDGTGDERTLHAGLPVLRGEKVGMNIWTREGAVGEGVRGE